MPELMIMLPEGATVFYNEPMRYVEIGNLSQQDIIQFSEGLELHLKELQDGE